MLGIYIVSCVDVSLPFLSIQDQQSGTLHVLVAGILGITTGSRFSPTGLNNA